MASGRRALNLLATRLTPRRLRFRLHDAGWAQRIAGRVPVDPSHPSADEAGRAQARWRSAAPRIDLTWGQALSGAPFVAKVVEHAHPGADTRILEIGPGYGRLLGAFGDAGVPFASYTGLDLSKQNVAHLNQKFGDGSRIRFIQGEVGTADVPPFDVCISSLTFKHFYPTFEAAVTNLAGSITDSGRLVFDLIEGSRVYFENDHTTYVHCYERGEVEQILERAGLKVIAFDEVMHGPDQARLLVVSGR